MIGKTYLKVSDVESEFQDRTFISHPPTCQLSFNKAVPDLETLRELQEAAAPSRSINWGRVKCAE